VPFVNRLLIVVGVLALAGCGSLPGRPAGGTTAAPPAAPVVTATELPVKAQWQNAYNQALATLRGGQTGEAERKLLALTREAPELSGPFANLGLLYRNAGRNVEAIAAFERAIEINPKRAMYYNELGISYRLEGKFDKARRSYRQAIDLDPGYAAAYLNLGILYDLYLQDPKEALPYYQRYKQLAPGDAATVSKWIIDLERRTGGKAPKEKNG
jgi:Flp pilus assembly protein TadD